MERGPDHPPPAPPVLPADAYRAAWRVAAGRMPDLAFCLHFMPHGQRGGVLALAALFDQLSDILNVRGQAAAQSQVATASCDKGEAAGQDARAAAPPGCTGDRSACQPCGGETLEQRRGVCAAVLTHLFEGQATGKPELDCFAEAARTLAIQRGEVETAIDALTALLATHRYATWKRLRQVVGDAAGAVATLAVRAAGTGPAQWTDLRRDQLNAWSTSLLMGWLLRTVGGHWRQGRLVTPLDDLVRFGLSEGDVDRFAAQGSSLGDPRWAECVASLVGRQENLYGGGTGCLRTMPAPVARAAAVFGEIQRRRWNRLIQDPDQAFATAPPPGLWTRLGSVPAALRLLARR